MKTRQSLLRVVRFRATHHYGREDRSPSWNRQVYGVQVEPHMHDFRVEVRVTGSVDPETGFLVDLGRLDDALHDVVGRLDGKDLNRLIPEVREGRMQPSTESLARWMFERLVDRIPDGVQLRSVRVWESDDLGAEAEATGD